LVEGALVRRELRDWVEELACRAGLDGLPRPAAVAAGALACVIVLAAVWRWGGGSGAADVAPPAAEEPGAEARAVAGPSAPASITVHVVGAVRSAGVISLPAGARAFDAVAAAGGLRDDAEASAVNLARQLADGEQVVIPVKGAAPPAGSVAAVSGGTSGKAGGAGAAGAKVNLNTADASALDTLPGVGPSTAAKIVADREQNGPFRRVEDLMRVPGIGTGKYEALKDLVTTG
jgi:competence protein ComEA